MNSVPTIPQPYAGLLTQPPANCSAAHIGLPNPVPNSVMPAYARLPEMPTTSKGKLRVTWFNQRQSPDGTLRPSRFSHGIKSTIMLSVVAVAIGFALHFMSMVDNKKPITANELSIDTSSLASQVSHFNQQAQEKIENQLVAAKTQVLAVKTATVTSLAKTEATIPDPQVMNIQLAKSKPTKARLAKQDKKKVARATSQAKLATPATTTPETSPKALPADSNLATPAPNDGVQYTHGHYAYGQCTYYVAFRRPVPANWGNARDWLLRSQAAGYLTGNIPVVGAIAQTTAGRYGHVAFVEAVDGDQVHIAEMNYVGWNKVSHRWVKASAFHYIYGPKQ